jgi:hypothetical protein
VYPGGMSEPQHHWFVKSCVGAAFWAFALGFQVSGFTSPLVALALFFIGAVLLVTAYLSWSKQRGWLHPWLAKETPSARVDTRASAPVRTEDRQGRIFVNVTPHYLIRLFDGYTSIQASNLVKPFIGKWIELSGQLGDILPYGIESAQVSFKRLSWDRPLHFVIMYFRGKYWLNRISVLKVGDPIKVIGQIQEVNSIAVHLDNCELV